MSNCPEGLCAPHLSTLGVEIIHGGVHKLGVLVVGVLVIRALLIGDLY